MTCLVSCYRAKSPLLEALEVQMVGALLRCHLALTLSMSGEPKKGKRCPRFCKRNFWNTDTLRRHQKTHTGTHTGAQSTHAQIPIVAENWPQKGALMLIKPHVERRKPSSAQGKVVRSCLPLLKVSKHICPPIRSCLKRRTVVLIVRRLASPDKHH